MALPTIPAGYGKTQVSKQTKRTSEQSEISFRTFMNRDEFSGNGIPDSRRIYESQRQKDEETKDADPATCQEQLSAHIQYLLEKLKRGETEEKFQIGAQALTIDEWNEFLEGFDAVQEKILEDMRERHQKQELKQEQQEEIAKSLTEERNTSP